MADQIDPAVLQELQQWKAFRESIIPKGTDLKALGKDPQRMAALNAQMGDPAVVAQFNGDTLGPAAKQYAVGMIDPATGKPRNGLNGMHFDVNTGEITKNKSGWDLPETKAIVAMAAGLGGLAAAPAIAGAFGGSSVAGGGAGASLGADAAGVSATSGLASGAGIGGAVAAPTIADVSGVVAGSGLGTGTLSKAAGLLKGKAGDLLGAAGQGIGAATDAAAQNRYTSGVLAQKEESDYNANLLARAKEEQSQRNDALKQGYYANYVQNRKPGPFNTGGITPYGSDTLATAMALAAQSKAKLANGARYDTSKMAPLQTPDEFMDKYGKPGTLEKIGNYAAPALTTLGKVARFF